MNTMQKRYLAILLFVSLLLTGGTWFYRFFYAGSEPEPIAAQTASATTAPPSPSHPHPMVVKFPAPQSIGDKRSDYVMALLRRVMEQTQAHYGSYEIEVVHNMSRDRQLTELKRGEFVTLTDSPASRNWESQVQPIFFPTRRGLQNYRLLLIEESQQALFTNIQSIEDLKPLRAGVNAHWLTRSIFAQADFSIVIGNDYEGLFQMLAHNRFDYFPRALNEIFQEIETRKGAMPNLMIEPTIALHLPSPTFFYVNKKNSVLHERITSGLWQLHNSGEFKRIFNQYHNEEALRKALKNRRVFHINNPYLNNHPIYQNANLWFRP